MLRRIPSILAIAIAGLTIGLVASTPVQRGLQEKDAGKKADKKGKGKKGGEIQQFPVRLERLRRQLEYARPVDSERQTLLWHSGVYASKADRIWKSQQLYIADRTLAAAEAILHASDHLEHLTSTQGFPPPPLPPPAEEAGRHLAQVYFRTREADFFCKRFMTPPRRRWSRWCASIINEQSNRMIDRIFGARMSTARQRKNWSVRWKIWLRPPRSRGNCANEG